MALLVIKSHQVDFQGPEIIEDLCLLSSLSLSPMACSVSAIEIKCMEYPPSDIQRNCVSVEKISYKMKQTERYSRCMEKEKHT